MTPPSWPTGTYAAILADPPWYYKTYSDKGRDRCADKHYRTMKLPEIMELPVAELAAPDCVLFMWATDPHLLKAIALIEEWGFTYKTVGFVWVKTCKRDCTKWHMGNGYWTRANPEYCLLALWRPRHDSGDGQAAAWRFARIERGSAGEDTVCGVRRDRPVGGRAEEAGRGD